MEFEFHAQLAYKMGELCSYSFPVLPCGGVCLPHTGQERVNSTLWVEEATPPRPCWACSNWSTEIQESSSVWAGHQGGRMYVAGSSPGASEAQDYGSINLHKFAASFFKGY